MNPPNLNELTDLTNSQKTGTQNFLNDADTKTNDFLSNFRNFVSTQPSTTQLAKQYGDELGIPALQGNFNRLQTTLQNIPNTYKNATAGFNVNANQLNKLVGQKSSELAPVVNQLGNSLTSANDTLTKRLGYSEQDFQHNLLPYQTQGDFLKDSLARATSLFSQENENELNALIQKINAGVTLSEGEKNRANQLALSEQSYQQQKDLAKSQNPNTQVIDVGGQKYLIDSGTGKIISKYGSSGGSGISSYLNNTGATPSFKPNA